MLETNMCLHEGWQIHFSLKSFFTNANLFDQDEIINLASLWAPTFTTYTVPSLSLNPHPPPPR